MIYQGKKPCLILNPKKKSPIIPPLFGKTRPPFNQLTNTILLKMGRKLQFT
jgi:hypothetical protein